MHSFRLATIRRVVALFCSSPPGATFLWEVEGTWAWGQGVADGAVLVAQAWAAHGVTGTSTLPCAGDKGQAESQQALNFMPETRTKHTSHDEPAEEPADDGRCFVLRRTCPYRGSPPRPGSKEQLLPAASGHGRASHHHRRRRHHHHHHHLSSERLDSITRPAGSQRPSAAHATDTVNSRC
ncbi:hypothetical protein V8C44DRAFT_265325 [Trichoderma aethiopicum]